MMALGRVPTTAPGATPATGLRRLPAPPLRRAPISALTAALRRVLATAALSVAAGGAGAEAPDVAALRLASLAASCAQCHGTEGRAPAGGPVPGLAGRPRALLLEHLLAFRAGTRASTVMAQLAKGYTEEQLAQLAGYFAARSP